MSPQHTLLVVDDEPDVVKSVQDLLRLDYRVLGATRAAEAMELLEEEEAQVVMTDQRMPEVTGVEFLRRLRGEHPDIVRLLFTGYADLRAVVDAINQGSVYRYITKPWEAEELQAVVRDAVDRYELLAERKRLIAELTEKNEALLAANGELRQADELKSAFIQVASHELRTPLTILRGMTKLSLGTPGLSPPLPNWLHRIDHAGERLQRLVDQLIAMLSANRFDQPLERREVDLAGLLDEAVDDVRPFLQLRRLMLTQGWSADLGTIWADPSRLRDCVNHLLLNAIKFTPDDGRITVSARRTEGGGAQIQIGDTGVGISPANLPHVFTPFFTGFDVSTHSSGHYEYGRKGIGLGLSVVKAFVEMHGGGIDVASEPGRGATFTLTLPGSAGARREARTGAAG